MRVTNAARPQPAIWPLVNELKKSVMDNGITPLPIKSIYAARRRVTALCSATAPCSAARRVTVLRSVAALWRVQLTMQRYGVWQCSVTACGNAALQRMAMHCNVWKPPSGAVWQNLAQHPRNVEQAGMNQVQNPIHTLLEPGACEDPQPPPPL